MTPPTPTAPPKRIQRNVLAQGEQRLLQWLCPRLPAWITPDRLTGLALAAAFVIGAAYALSNESPAWLAIAVAGYFVHWFGDSLDGTIARYRRIERPRFGYFIDHSCDGLATLLIIGGIGASPYLRVDIALFVVVAYLWIVGFSNAVNLTDGLDGLAIMPAVLVAAALGAFAYLAGNAVFSAYLGIPSIPGAGELSVFCGALTGAGLGFLWFNTYPAQVFMGDVGALAIGAAIGCVAVIVRQEIILLVMGGLFVVETASVMLQVGSFKLRGKRVFRMAPIHHHFELKGWPEPRVIVRFWIISVVLVLVGLATLKVR